MSSRYTLAEELRIFEDGALIVTHPILEGRHQRHVEPGDRNIHVHKRPQRLRNDEVILHGSGDQGRSAPAGLLRRRRPGDGEGATSMTNDTRHPPSIGSAATSSA